MKLHAKFTPYSSVVGGGLTLCDRDGRVRFLVMICGAAEGITKDENEAISKYLAHAFTIAPLELPERE